MEEAEPPAPLPPCPLTREQLDALEQLGNCLPPEFSGTATGGYPELCAMAHGYTPRDFVPEPPACTRCSAPGCTEPFCCVEYRTHAPLCRNLACFLAVTAPATEANSSTSSNAENTDNNNKEEAATGT